MKRIGVFVCHCGINIAGAIDTKKVVEEIKKYPGVAYASDYVYVCSDPGQNLIKEKIKEEKLDAVIVAACSPSLHEQTFRSTVALAGLNPYQMESANIREQVSWVHPDKEVATQKAVQIIRSLVEKIRLNENLTPFGIPVTRRAMVIGGGISGIQAALDIANSGHEVILVEKEPSIGGHMIQLSETFPTLDCSQCIMTPRMVELNQHPKIELLAYSEVEDVSGYIGNFKVKVRKKARYVDLDKCTACTECDKVCPVEVPSDFDCGLANRKAAYRPFPQAVPNAFVIEKTEPAPCKIACPIHQDVPGYMAMVRVGKYKEAINLIRKTNPLPGICGRVCYHPCEGVCRRLYVDEPLSISAIKRFAADFAVRSGEGVQPPEIAEQREERVAIIGSGPAGLSAAHDLALLGYRSTIFEALPVAGGMLAAAIPDYRLPRDVLQADIDYIKKMGVEILTGITIGKDLTISDLQDQGYRAIFVAAGAHKGLELNIPGKNMEGICQGIDFLRQVNLKGKAKVGRRVAVIGGGNSAMDATRTALRLGAEEVKIIYRRSRQEMPASDEEIKESEEEGVEFHYLLAPTAFLGQDGKLTGLRLIKMKLGEVDATGRRRPIPVESTEHEMPIDTVILAIGQAPELTFMDARSTFDLTRWNTLLVDDKTLATNIPGVFAGGDVVSGPASVIEAISAGKKAAVTIHRYLCGELEEYRSELEREEEERRQKEEAPEPDWAEVYKERARQKRAKVPELPRDDRTKNFQEVSLGYGEKEAQEEASRCLACGTCVECMECVKACEVGAIDHQMKDEVEELQVGAIVVATGYDLYPLPEIGEYGYGKYKDVIDGLQFERLLSASGPTLGQIRRPSDGKVPKEVVFIKCVRSRDQERGMPYCSKICCMYTAKHAMLYKHRVPDGQAYVFYMDIRAGGKGYEEFVQRATEQDEVLYLRGRVSKVFQQGEKIIVWGTDTLTGEKIEIAADLVVLATAMLPNKATAELVKKLKVPTDPYGFLNEAHPKLRPVEFISAGLYLAGCCQAPKDIPEAVAQASGAASKVAGLFSREELFHDPAVTGVDEDLCCGCGICVEVCPYKARKLDTEKKIVEVNTALCEGCGVCGAACPTGAAQPKNFTDKQMLEMVSSILRD